MSETVAGRFPPETGALARYTPQVDTTALAAVMEKVLIDGDLRQLSSPERLLYYVHACHTAGLHPGRRPFDLVPGANGALTLYLNREGCEQLRALHQLSVTILSRDYVGDLYVVMAEGTLPSGRRETAEASVSMVTRGGARLQGTEHANARMRCESKAKRRVTLALCWGGGPEAVERRPLTVDLETDAIEDGDEP